MIKLMKYGIINKMNANKDYNNMVASSQKLQAHFLNSLSKDKVAVTVFLVNGVKLTGHIVAFDDNSLLLGREGHMQLVYKHAISTIMPEVGFSLSLD